MNLPDYLPPNAQRASVAAALSPVLVLLTFTLTVTRVIETDTALACGIALTIWVYHEMSVFQRALDAYDRDYVARHLAWRSPETLRRFLTLETAHAPTREFVRGFLDRDRWPLVSDPSR